ncbi:carbon-nitrogen hydrolase [Jimgerdemannia flammicorona]|uniref:Glutamine-dependent NAD(+) synthetase n=1 Tax=Jimgerdemannia flammicorona TaxID=994334 RepID=A0A433D0K6_9FUNG|nr:carbon-nitrogen hydrolase [Jimgerdemannia flammicorona]
MGHLITVATCALNQWALDFEGNLNRILESIRIAKKRGATLRRIWLLRPFFGGCVYFPFTALVHDRFNKKILNIRLIDRKNKGDTYLHSWEMLSIILNNEETHGILLDVGMPVMHKTFKYNCRVIVLNGKILLIRPKMYLANDGNYREMRFFTPWIQKRVITVPFGDAVIATTDTCIGVETCEELFTPNSPHIGMGLDGVEIFTNSSGSHHELRKLNTRIDLIKEATQKLGGVYLYSNQQGCDGDRLYYDGCALVAVNGQIVSQGSQFSLKDVEVITATIDIEDVRSFRGSSASRGIQASESPAYHRIFANISLSGIGLDADIGVRPDKMRPPFYHTPEQEITLGPACWMWDYLRRSKTGGYFLPLSGGIDSCATATIVASMCRLVAESAREGDIQVIKDARRMTGEPEDSEYLPTDPREFANRIFHTCYMGTENSSQETRVRAKELAELSYRSQHGYCRASSARPIFVSDREGPSIPPAWWHRCREPCSAEHPSSPKDGVSLPLRPASSMGPWKDHTCSACAWKCECGRKVGRKPVPAHPTRRGDLVTLRGYLTKYDCSSADINPIGAISKTDLKRFIAYAQKEFDMPILEKFLTATPTAELEPITKDYVQADEIDMGMTYDELSIFGRLRKIERCGPFSMFSKLVHEWGEILRPSQVAEKVKRFFFYYSINRHKLTTLTPSYHAESYSPDDNRFDLRPFLYNASWSWQFKRIDQAAEALDNLNNVE